MAEDFFGNLSKTLKKTVDTVGKKTDEFVEIQKIRTRQHVLEDQIEKNYQDIGQIIYNRYLNGEAFDENLAGICKDAGPPSNFMGGRIHRKAAALFYLCLCKI